MTSHMKLPWYSGFSLHFYWIGQIWIWRDPPVLGGGGGGFAHAEFFWKLEAKSCILAYYEHKILYMKKTQFLPFSLRDPCFICIFVVIYLRDESCEEPSLLPPKKKWAALPLHTAIFTTPFPFTLGHEKKKREKKKKCWSGSFIRQHELPLLLHLIW